jgi:ABC-2 type transport system ATP-binding protein
MMCEVMKNVVLKVENLTKTYDDITVVDHISFEIKEGEVVGLLGPNGAGKTTTIHMLLSLLAPTEGKIEIFGKDLAFHREEILEKMNFAAPYAGLPYNLTIQENLTIFGLLYEVRGIRQKIESLLRDFELVHFRNKRTGTLSSGEHTRLALAKAFLNDPKLLLLDEPTSSLDPAIARRFRTSIYYRMKTLGGVILWTSHNMREVEEMCSRIIFLSKGKIVADGTQEDLRTRFHKQDLEEIFVSLAEN